VLGVSLGFIVLVIGGSVVASLLWPPQDGEESAAPEGEAPAAAQAGDPPPAGAGEGAVVEDQGSNRSDDRQIVNR